MEIGTFKNSGLATLDDLETSESRDLFRELEAIQTDFLSKEPHPPGYLWPRDPLHQWSRVWEYPYVLYHIRKWRRAWTGQGTPKTLDFGCGTTFFPFALAREGFNVTCIDKDPICGEGVKRARELVNCEPGDVSFRLSEGSQLPIETESIDVLYSISVLEHLPEPSAVIEEFARVLAPSGLLILTFDIAMEQTEALGLSPVERSSLCARLSQYFEISSPRGFVHPATILTSSRGPCPMHRKERGFPAAWRTAKERVLKPLLRRPPRSILHLSCEGLTCQKLLRSYLDKPRRTVLAKD